MADLKHKPCAFNSSHSRDGSIFLSVSCKCSRCGATKCLPVSDFKEFSSYDVSDFAASDFCNNPNISAYVPDGWHVMNDPIGLVCDSCYQEIVDFAKKPKEDSGEDEPKTEAAVAVDRDGIPLDFDTLYEYDANITGKIKTMYVFPSDCNVLLRYKVPYTYEDEVSEMWVSSKQISRHTSYD